MMQSNAIASDIELDGEICTRGSVSIAAASHVTTPYWVLDSGASFHVTFDKSKLVACKPITDGTSIHTADGTSCQITHQGSLHSSFLYTRCLMCTSIIYEFSISGSDS